MTPRTYRFYGGPYHGQERVVRNTHILQGGIYNLPVQTAITNGVETPSVSECRAYELVGGDFLYSGVNGADLTKYSLCVHVYNAYPFELLLETTTNFLRELANLPPEYHVCLQTFGFQVDPDTHTLRMQVVK